MTTPLIPPKSNGPVLEIPADLETVYANLARIAHSPADIVIDFAHLLPGEPRAKIRAEFEQGTPQSGWQHVMESRAHDEVRSMSC